MAAGQSTPVYAGSGDGLNIPLGLALDPAAGRIYWTNYGDDKIQRAPLDGSGPAAVHYGSAPAHGVNDPVGLTIDPAAGWLYWSQDEWDNQLGVVGKIRRAPLDGSGPVVTLYGRPWDGVFYPGALVVDPTAPGRRLNASIWVIPDVPPWEGGSGTCSPGGPLPRSAPRGGSTGATAE